MKCTLERLILLQVLFGRLYCEIKLELDVIALSTAVSLSQGLVSI